MSGQMRIGEALVDCGAIDEKQLQAALAAQRETSSLPLGRLLTDRFKVPVEVVDQANVRSVILPRFRKMLLTRLLALSRGDKFAKGLDMVDFVTSITTIAERFEVRVYDCRRYRSNGNGFSRDEDDRGFVTIMDVRVKLKTKNGHDVEGMLNLEHDSQDDRLIVADDEARIKESLYYNLRTAFRSR